MRASDIITRRWALIPVIFSLTAFILSMLCIFAGSKRGYLEDADLFTVNTSMLGSTSLNISKNSSPILKSVKNTIQKDVHAAVSDVAKALNIRDFYSAHLLDYCEGYYTPTPFTNLTSQPSRNITFCSNQTSFFHFDPAAAIQSELKAGVTLEDLQWPSKLQDGVHAVKGATEFLYVLYFIAVVSTCAALVAALVGVRMVWRYSALINIILSAISFFTLILASTVATIVINHVVKAINKYGNDIGVYAYKGGTFIGMTWAATVLVFVTGCMWVYERRLEKKGMAFLGKGEGDYE